MSLSGSYLRLAASLSQAIKTGNGAVVVGLPGMGVSHFLEIFAKFKADQMVFKHLLDLPKYGRNLLSDL